MVARKSGRLATRVGERGMEGERGELSPSKTDLGVGLGLRPLDKGRRAGLDCACPPCRRGV